MPNLEGATMVTAKRVRIELEVHQRNLVLKHVCLCHPDLEERLQKARSRNGYITLNVTKEELDDFIGCVAREANHTTNRSLENELDEIFIYLEGADSGCRNDRDFVW
jgi:hypothetical protein